MKIGIITLPPYANYGGILQAYALCHVLRDMGHEPEVIYITKRWYVPWWRKPMLYAKRAVKKFVLHRQEWVFFEKKAKREWPVITAKTFAFVEKRVPHRIFDEYSSISEKDYDAYVVGSDQVWRPIYYFWSDVADAFLRFAKDWNVKRIAYAASFGVDNWEYTPEQTKTCARLAKLFDAISVRETSAIDLCHEYFGIEAKHVVDPTLLLEREDYMRLIDDDATPHKGEILNYILDWNDNKRLMLNLLEKTTGKKSFRVNSRFEEWGAPIEERIQPSVESWLQGFRDADLVVTDSFHATVFSIIFNKPFFVIGNKERGITRFKSLLSMFGLEDRLVCSAEAVDVSASIDWNNVNKLKQQLKATAMAFLSSNLART